MGKLKCTHSEEVLYQAILAVFRVSVGRVGWDFFLNCGPCNSEFRTKDKSKVL